MQLALIKRHTYRYFMAASRKRIRFFVDGVLLAPGADPTPVAERDCNASGGTPAVPGAAPLTSSSLFYVPSTVPCCVVSLDPTTADAVVWPPWRAHHHHLVEGAIGAFPQPRHLLHCHGSFGLAQVPWELPVVQQGLPQNAAGFWSLPPATPSKKSSGTHARRHRQPPMSKIRFPLATDGPVTVVSLLKRHGVATLDAKRRSLMSPAIAGKRKPSGVALDDIFRDDVRVPYPSDTPHSISLLSKHDNGVNDAPSVLDVEPGGDIAELPEPVAIGSDVGVNTGMDGPEPHAVDVASPLYVMLHLHEMEADTAHNESSRCCVRYAPIAPVEELNHSPVPCLPSPSSQHVSDVESDLPPHLHITEIEIHEYDPSRLHATTTDCVSSIVHPVESDYLFEFLCVLDTLHEGTLRATL